jgi:hypothetical protein
MKVQLDIKGTTLLIMRVHFAHVYSIVSSSTISYCVILAFVQAWATPAENHRLSEGIERCGHCIGWCGSFSIGVAARKANMQNMEDLIKATDEGVYAAKLNGRNCVASISRFVHQDTRSSRYPRLSPRDWFQIPIFSFPSNCSRFAAHLLR